MQTWCSSLGSKYSRECMGSFYAEQNRFAPEVQHAEPCINCSGGQSGQCRKSCSTDYQINNVQGGNNFTKDFSDSHCFIYRRLARSAFFSPTEKNTLKTPSVVQIHWWDLLFQHPWEVLLFFFPHVSLDRDFPLKAHNLRISKKPQWAESEECKLILDVNVLYYFLIQTVIHSSKFRFATHTSNTTEHKHLPYNP